MFWDDLRKVLNGPRLWRLDGMIGEKLVPVFYGFGLAAIGLWAVDHLFASFAFNFSQGLWGILEILVYGPLWVLALRLASELVLVLLRANAAAAASVDRTRLARPLFDEVSDAIHDLAQDDDDEDIVPATDPAPFLASGEADDIDPLIKGTVPRRTAKRTPPIRP